MVFVYNMAVLYTRFADVSSFQRLFDTIFLTTNVHKESYMTDVPKEMRIKKPSRWPMRKSYTWDKQKEEAEHLRKLQVWAKSRARQGKPALPIWWQKP